MTPGTRHPARFLDGALAVAEQHVAALPRPCVILDPFAGVGGVHQLAGPGIVTVGVELEVEWARQHERTVVGDARDLGRWPDSSIDAVVSSPCYGNRMADHHEAADACRACLGLGSDQAGGITAICPTCKGSGLSRRNTYRHALGRPLTDGNSGAMQWGPSYRQLHEQAMAECLRVLVPGGLICWNVKNHVRGGFERLVAEWHLNAWLVRGCHLVEARPVAAPGNRQGANGTTRVPVELVLVLHAPDPEARRP